MVETRHFNRKGMRETWLAATVFAEGGLSRLCRAIFNFHGEHPERGCIRETVSIARVNAENKRLARRGAREYLLRCETAFAGETFSPVMIRYAAPFVSAAVADCLLVRLRKR